MMSQAPGEPIFREVQRPRSWWYIGLFVAIAAAAWAGFVVQIVFNHPIGNNPSSDWGVWVLTLVFGIGFPLAFLGVKLETSVFAERVAIRWFPITTRTIPFAEIVAVEARVYRPIAEYRGWGIKMMPGRKIAYSMSGNEGVNLTLTDGRQVMIGSERAAELAAAIESRGGTG
jgi:hypothetical protein